MMTNTSTIQRLAIKHNSSVRASGWCINEIFGRKFLSGVECLNIPALTLEAGKPCPLWEAHHGLLAVGLAVVAGAEHRQAS